MIRQVPHHLPVDKHSVRECVKSSDPLSQANHELLVHQPVHSSVHGIPHASGHSPVVTRHHPPSPLITTNASETMSAAPAHNKTPATPSAQTHNSLTSSTSSGSATSALPAPGSILTCVSHSAPQPTTSDLPTPTNSHPLLSTKAQHYYGPREYFAGANEFAVNAVMVSRWDGRSESRRGRAEVEGVAGGV